jgi:hypothetical protein
MQPKATSYNDIFLLELESLFCTSILNGHSHVYLAWRQHFLTASIDLAE